MVQKVRCADQSSSILVCLVAGSRCCHESTRLIVTNSVMMSDSLDRVYRIKAWAALSHAGGYREKTLVWSHSYWSTLQRRSQLWNAVMLTKNLSLPTRHVSLSSRIYFLYELQCREKILIDNKFEAQTLTGNPTGNSRLYALASRALNMSCSFGQSARSTESRGASQ